MRKRPSVPDHWWKKRGTFWSAFVSGMAGLSLFAEPPPFTKSPHASASDALRSDWLRIGADFRVVIERNRWMLEQKRKAGNDGTEPDEARTKPQDRE